MLLSGIYSAEFFSSIGRFGTGVAVFTDNTIHGGDADHFYQGKYSRLEPDNVKSTVYVKRYAGSRDSSVVGLDEFRLDLTGKIPASDHGTTLTLDGFVIGEPSRRIRIELRKLDDLVDAEKDATAS